MIALDDLYALCRRAEGSSGDDSLSITVLLRGRADDDDDFGGIVVGCNAEWVTIESWVTRTIPTITYGEIDAAWLCDLNGNVVMEYKR